MSDPIAMLNDRIRDVEQGRLTLDHFFTWFRSVRWTAFNTPQTAPYGWAIETTGFEYEGYPQYEYTAADLREVFRNVQRQAKQQYDWHRVMEQVEAEVFGEDTQREASDGE